MDSLNEMLQGFTISLYTFLKSRRSRAILVGADKLQVTALGPLSRMPPLVELRRRTAARR